jgi:hypothetical protein
MDMQVLDRLAAVFAGVEDDAVAFAEALLAGDCGGGQKQVTEQRLLAGVCLIERVNMRARHKKHVRGCRWIDVGEAVALLVLIDLVRGNCACDDLAEKAIHNAFSVHAAATRAQTPDFFVTRAALAE